MRFGFWPRMLAALVLVSITARAATAEPQTSDPDSALAKTLRSIVGAPLALDDAIQRALVHSTDVAEAEAALRAAEGVLRRERGGFDPSLFADATWSSEKRPRASVFAETEHGTHALDVGAAVDLQTGGHLEASVRSTRETTDAPFASFSPQYTTRGSIDLVQPLLKGFGPAARQDLSVAERDLAAARAAAEATRRGIEARVERSYWDLYAAERDYAVDQLLRDGGAAVLDEARTRARAGLGGPNQVATARVFLADREVSLLDREERMDALSDDLGTLLGARPEGGVIRFRPTAEPPRDFTLGSTDAVVREAMERNPTLQLYVQQADAARARARGARWMALPALDFVGSLGANGLTGTGRTLPVFSNPDSTQTLPSLGDFGDSWREVFQGDFPAWSAGVRFSLPLGLRADRGERDRTGAEVLVAEQHLEGARRALEAQVRQACRELEHARERLRLTAGGVEASLEQVRIGRLEYQSGRTTAFELVRLAADLATAEQHYSQALVRAANAAASLRELTAGAEPLANQ